MNYLVILCYLLVTSDQHQLIIEVSQIEEIKGNIMVAAYDSNATFLTRSVIANGQFVVTEETVTCQMDLPFGRYAISIYHDVNSNRELDSNVFRIPKEPVGFSNNAKGFMGPPKFDEVTFDFDHDGQVIEIELN